MDNELMNLIKSRIEEENNDSIEYDKIAKHAREVGATKMCKVFCDLANEERSHANILENLLTDVI